MSDTVRASHKEAKKLSLEIRRLCYLNDGFFDFSRCVEILEPVIIAREAAEARLSVLEDALEFVDLNCRLSMKGHQKVYAVLSPNAVKGAK